MPENTPKSTTAHSPTVDRSSVLPEWVWLVGIMLLGLALRLYRLGDRDYWNDEIYNLYKTLHLREVLTEGTYVSNHPPLFGICTTFARFLGLSDVESSMRLVPVAFGVVNVFAVYLIGRKLFGARAGLFAGFIFAIAPMHILHSQDLKPYVALPLTGTLAAYFLYTAFDTNRRQHWALYGLFAGLACYSELFAAQLLISLNVWSLFMLYTRRDRFKGWLISNIGGALFFLPYLSIMIGKVQTVIVQPEVWWIPPPSIMGFLFFVKAVTFGYSDLQPHFKLAMVWFGIFGCAGTLMGIRAHRKATFMLLFWFLLSVLLTVFLSLYFKQSIFLYRAMFPFVIPIFLFVGYGASKLPRTSWRTISVGIFALIAAFPLYEHYNEIYPAEEFPHRPGIHFPVDFRDSSSYILENWDEDDAVVATAYTVWFPYSWFGVDVKRMFHTAADQGYIDIQTGLGGRNSPDPLYDNYFAVLLEPTVQNLDRLWFTFSDWERAYYEGNTLEVWRWLEAHYEQIRYEPFKNIEVFYYVRKTAERPIELVSRLTDNGVTATVTYAEGDRSWPYEKTRPDTGLVASSHADRAGSLFVSFGENDADGNVTVRLRNTGNAPVSCLVEWIASDELIDFASFYDTNEDLDIWALGAMADTSGKTNRFGLSVAQARLEEAGEATIQRVLVIAPGDYVADLLYRHTSESGLTLKVGSARFTVPTQSADVPADAWSWRRLDKLTVDGSALDLEATITVGEAQAPANAGLAYLALNRISDDVVPAESAVHRSEQLTIEVGTQSAISLQVPSTKGILLWVHDGEHSYHIFKSGA